MTRVADGRASDQRGRLRRLLWAALALGVLTVSATAYAHASAAKPAVLHGDAVWQPGAKPAPDLALRDQDGRLVTMASLRGHQVLLTFLDSQCTKDCPIEGHELATLGHQLGRSARPVLLVVSVNPTDRPATARAFVHQSGLDTGWTWYWLMGTKAQLAPVWKSYDITVIPQNGDIAHSTVLYLIDAKGQQRAGYLFPFPLGAVTTDVRALAAETRGWVW